jgi:hypothetical protein
MAPQSLGFSAGFLHIDQALRSRWAGFALLESEIQKFVPRPRTAYAEQEAAALARDIEANPHIPVEDLEANVKKEIDFLASNSWQVQELFEDRHMTEYVTVVLLSHGLCESLINAILAIGLAHAGIPDVFELLERSDIKNKWLHGPKSFKPSYVLPSGTGIYQTLVKLTRQRNAIVHYKIDVSVGGQNVISGSKPDRESYAEELKWIRRFFSLPYDLSARCTKWFPDLPLHLLSDHGSIAPARQHAN